MKSLRERVWEKCIPVPESGCWLWVGSTFNHGTEAQVREIRATYAKGGMAVA